MTSSNHHVVIMAGGIGSRLWPISTPSHPKQFIDVMGMGKSLIQLTVDRFRPLAPLSNFWVVTSAKYVSIVHEQIPDIPENHILAEPEARNTAPCIAYACWKIKKEAPDANIVVTPSDALVIDTAEFQRTVDVAFSFTEQDGRIVTLGMKPTRPETGYGYIQAGEMVPGTEISRVNAFREKPDFSTAEDYLRQGGYYWNAGIFVWNVHTIEHELRLYAPQICGLMDQLTSSLFTELEERELSRLFPQCEKISIDYAVMEKSPNIYVLPAEFGWSDLGSWGAIHSLLPHDEENNALVGTQIRLHDCTGTIVHLANPGKKVIIEGLDGYIVAETEDNLLICRLKNEQNIKEYSQE